MSSTLRSAIIATLKYARFFNFHLTQSELHFWLIYSKTVSKTHLTRSLSSLPSGFTQEINQSLPSARQRRLRITEQKLAMTSSHIRLLSYLPTIRLIALTGSLAVNNARSDDDIDLMIVTTRHTLWLTRLLATTILFLLGKKRLPATNQSQPDTLCINLWLDTSSLAVPRSKQNLYTAHEVLQIKPLYNRNQTYQHFLTQNNWTARFLANAYHQLTLSISPALLPKQRESQFFCLFAPFNILAFVLQYLYMKPKITRESVSLNAAYFHPRNLSPQINSFLKSET